jgi:NADP-dependent 3-hydroxy acid dehydrogenase YdfG
MENKKGFEDQIVVVTGASAGIGRAIAIAFAKEGAHVALIARNKERLEEARKEAEGFGVKDLGLPLDVADAEALENAAAQAERVLGTIDI